MSSPFSEELTTAEMAAMAELGIDPDQLRASLGARPPESAVKRALSRRALGRAFAVLGAASLAAMGVGLSSSASDLENLHRRVEKAERRVVAARALRTRAADSVEAAPLDTERAWVLARSERYLDDVEADLAEARRAYERATDGPVHRWLASQRGLPR